MGDWPIGAAAAVVWLDGASGPGEGGPGEGGPGGERIAEAGLGLTAVGAPNFAAAEAEEFLRGAPAGEETFAEAGRIAAENCNPVSDQRGPADYKRHLARELTVRALRRAVRRAATPRGPR